MGFCKNARYFKAKCVFFLSFSLPWLPLSPCCPIFGCPRLLPSGDLKYSPVAQYTWLVFEGILLCGHPHSSFLLQSRAASRENGLYPAVRGLKYNVHIRLLAYFKGEILKMKTFFSMKETSEGKTTHTQHHGERGSVWQHLKNRGRIFIQFMYPWRSAY